MTPSAPDTPQDPRAFRAMRFVETITDLPTIPTVLAKIQKLLANPDASATDLGRVISSDAAVCAKILRVVNSSFYGLENKVTSVPQAIVILGFRALRQLVVGLSVFNKLQTKVEHRFFRPEQFLLHSLAVGATCKHLAQRFRLPGEAEEYFVAGLLHDTGKMILASFMAPLFQDVAEILESQPVAFCVAERETYATDHGFLGGALFTKWGFDTALIRGVEYHHAPLEIPDAEQHPQACLIASLIHCADVLARLMLLGDLPDRILPPVSAAAFQQLEESGLRYEELPSVMRDIHKEYVAAKVFLAL